MIRGLIIGLPVTGFLAGAYGVPAAYFTTAAAAFCAGGLVALLLARREARP